jgi:hypothetical protein
MRADVQQIRVYEHGQGDLHADAILPFPLPASPSRGGLRRSARRFTVGGHWSEALAIVVLALALALLIGKAVGVARYEAAILSYPYQRDDAEGVILAEATLMTEGTDPYAYQPSPAHHF